MAHTPEERAQELVAKFTFSRNESGVYVGTLSTNLAKQCALIAVDEILQAFDDFFMIPIKEIKFWKQVKEAILKL